MDQRMDSQANWGERLRAAIWAVARRRCPACGKGPAFAGIWRLRARCPNCGRLFQQHPGTTTGVMQVGAMAVVVFAILAWFLIELLTDWTLDQGLTALVLISLVFGVWFYPYAKLTWEAVDWLIDSASNGGQRGPE
jgi:uncharacterized protein (DUF983 family)